MVSKELLSAVLDIDVSTIQQITNYGWRDNIEGLRPMGASLHEINQYELAHKCKEWAAFQNFKIKSELTYKAEDSFHAQAKLLHNQEMGFCVFGFQRQHTYESDWFTADSEPVAIFKACEWILQNKGV